jgi:hypothetical protein
MGIRLGQADFYSGVLMSIQGLGRMGKKSITPLVWLIWC